MMVLRWLLLSPLPLVRRHYRSSLKTSVAGPVGEVTFLIRAKEGYRTGAKQRASQEILPEGEVEEEVPVLKFINYLYT